MNIYIHSYDSPVYVYVYAYIYLGELRPLYESTHDNIDFESFAYNEDRSNNPLNNPP